MRWTLCCCILSLACTAFAEMPTHVRATVEDHLVGAWTSIQDFDGKKTRGTIINRWDDETQTLIGKGTQVDDSTTVEMNLITRWDDEKNALVERGISTDGGHWTIHWTNLGEDRWTGQGEGYYMGEAWKSSTTLSFADGTVRYEDTTQGKPFVIDFTRRNGETARREFDDFAGYMTHGKWVKTKPEGKKESGVHRLADSKSFVLVDNTGDGELFVGVYGVHPLTKKLTFWGFGNDGSVSSSSFNKQSEGKGTWTGIAILPDGSIEANTAKMTIVDDDTIEFDGAEGESEYVRQ